ncbi:MAG: DNA polymerase IV [Candidatus Levybacteria bacterium]|nr:DNA polymerase IV [Candidatus Levybacteria bacterium]
MERVLPNTKRIILHIDFDSFFASVEQQCNPLLRNKPIGVTATNGRSCIIASSREAKKLGIKTGCRTYDALRLCPQIQLVPADFWKYWEISKKFIAIGKDFSPFLEVFSLDEIFLDATTTAHLFGGVEGLIEKIKTRIRKEIGEYITVSIGVSHNKLLAKLGSDLKKPNGVTMIRPHQVQSVYAIAKLQDICGIGPRIEERLNAMGIYTLAQLHKTPLSFLMAEFGNIEGHFLYNVGKGIDTRPVLSYTEEPPVKSIGRQYCLPQNEHNQRIVLQNIYELYEEVGIKLRRLNKKARGAGLALYGAYEAHGHITKQEYVDTGPKLFGYGMEVLKQKYDGLPVGYVRRISVWASYLEDSSRLPLPLFLQERKKEKVIKVVDALNERFGDHTIRNGFLANAAKLTTTPNGWMADTYERTKLARSSS